MIIAGEASGDLHGAGLIKQLKNINPEIKIFGIGGDKMINAGMDAQYHIKRMAFLGFIEVIRHLPFIKKVQKDLLEKIKKECIETIVLIDYPGFNLDIAKKLKSMGKRIIYYISPQVWAWGKGRVSKIKKLVDKMIVVFPFEEEFYKNYGIDVNYVGHPLIEQIDNYKFLTKNELYEKFGLDKEKGILLLLPGSRKHEIKKIFPDTIKAALKLGNDFNLQVVVACADNIDNNIFHKFYRNDSYKIIKGFTYDLYKYAYIGIIKSGTSTLEAGLFQLPFVVVYSTNELTYRIGKLLVQINNIAMANIILQENVVDELIQKDMNTEEIYKRCERLINDKMYYDSIKLKLGELKTKLGGIGASLKAAKIINTAMNET